MIRFKGTHFPKDVILYAVFFYVRYGVSYRDLEEISIFSNSSHLEWRAGLSDTILKGNHPGTIPALK
jgi:hypothetical protein